MRQNSWRSTIRPVRKTKLNPDTPYADIAERLRWHRELTGMEQDEYAAKAGLRRSQLSNWLNGSARLSIDGALALRRTYGLSLDFMYEGSADALPMTLRLAWLERPTVKASK
jgi:transcriptional regulator with XRE-family HTH domain